MRINNETVLKILIRGIFFFRFGLRGIIYGAVSGVLLRRIKAITKR